MSVFYEEDCVVIGSDNMVDAFFDGGGRGVMSFSGVARSLNVVGAMFGQR